MKEEPQHWTMLRFLPLTADSGEKRRFSGRRLLLESGNLFLQQSNLFLLSCGELLCGVGTNFYILHSPACYGTLIIASRFFLDSISAVVVLRYSPELTDLESWLTFLTAVDPEEICALIEAFPMYKAMYNRLYRSIG